MAIQLAGAVDKDLTPWILAFGAYGATHILTYASSLEDALDECVDWLADNAPGLLADDAVADEYRRIRAACQVVIDHHHNHNRTVAELEEATGVIRENSHDHDLARLLRDPTPKTADEISQVHAEIDTTCAGTNGHYLHSWEWTILAEDPSPAEIARIHHGR